MTRIFFLTFYILLIFFCTAKTQSINAWASPNLNPEKDEVTSKDYRNLELQSALNKAAENNYIVVGNKKYPASPLLNRFYQSREYGLAWFNKDMEPNKELFTYLKALKNSNAEGLDPNFYYLDSIEKNIKKLRNLEEGDLKLRVVQVDLLISDSNLLYFSDLLYGRHEFGGNFMEQSYSDPRIDIVASINKAMVENNFQQAVNSLLPQSYSYHVLKQSLVKYEKIKKNGGWQPIPLGKTLKVVMNIEQYLNKPVFDAVLKDFVKNFHMNDERIVILKRRLYATGDLNVYGIQSIEQYLNKPVFDAVLKDSVKNFQRRHGLKEDGEVEESTVTVLNIPLDKKIDSIKMNLDVWRKLPRNLGNKYVIVNIPAFKLFGVQNNTTALEMRVIVGSLDWNTPVFSEHMEYVVINPYWNIPPSIFENEVLPELRNNPDYLKRKNLQVISLETDTVQKNYSQNWSEVDPENFNYRLRQLPGATNPLGRLKFIFPNKHNVYLHDTPDRKLFDKTDRKLSHGCIRIEKPIRLTEFVFNDDSEWDTNRIRSEIDSGQSKEVYLKQPIPVYVMYFTVWVEDDNSVHFRDDFYNFLALF